MTRLKQNANPTITRLIRNVRGASVPVEGEALRDVLPRLKREVLDCEVEVAFRHREYAGSRKGAKANFRIVAILDDESREYHTYLTNIDPETLKAEDVAALYAARWEIELVFKELKSQYALDELGIRNARAVEALVWTAILTLVTSRILHRAVTRQITDGGVIRFTGLRWSRVFREQAPGILNDVLCYEGIDVAKTRMSFLRWAAEDPNKNRHRLLDAVRE